MGVTLFLFANLRVCFLSCSPSVVWVCVLFHLSVPDADVVQVHRTGGGGDPLHTNNVAWGLPLSKFLTPAPAIVTSIVIIAT